MNDRKRVLELFDSQRDQWVKRSNEGIEKYRKGELCVTAVSSDGKEITGARVQIKQKSHEFRFGANIFMLDELETERKNQLYKQYFADLFNMATLPFYWDTLEPEQGKPRYAKDSARVYRRPAIDLCMEFCDKHGIEPREHALAYDNFFPQWLYNASVDEIKAALEKRCAEIAKRYADKIPTIEVTNEMEWETGRTAFYDQPDFVEWCFKTAEKYFPNNILGINEHTGLTWEDKCRATDKYYSYIEANMLKGARIDAIGMQYHLFNKAEHEYERTRKTLNPKLLYKHMDMYAGFNKPLQITEITVPAYSNDAEDEAIQAEILTNLYRIWFSHPAVHQIIYWNLVDGYAHVWDPDPEVIRASQGNMTLGENYYYGGLLRFDMSPKPAYRALCELINKEWRTECSATTGIDGNARLRGFFGEYEVSVTYGEKTVTATASLSSKNTDNKITVKL